MRLFKIENTKIRLRIKSKLKNIHVNNVFISRISNITKLD